MADGSQYMTQLNSFAPGPETQRDFRDALGQFATGVTVITVATPQGPMGMTANSFSSISMDPPLVMWSPAKSSRRYAPFAQATHFAIHVMGTAQEDMAMRFAKSGEAFDGLEVMLNAQGVPLLDDCIARFECQTHQVVDAGDHSIILGLVEAVAHRPGAPLVFCQGAFRAFDKQA